jgi:cytochrome c oxidase cbb3-type subunit III
MVHKVEKDLATGTDTTGHEWDGIKELNTPLPRWWLWTFYACILFAIGYVIAYPAIPLPGGNTKGILGHTNRGALADQMEQAKTQRGEWTKKIEAASLDDIKKDPALLAFAVAGGGAAFKVNCVQCHGAGAQGGRGFPNLNDNDWLWGGTLDQIHTTLQNGIRYPGNANTRDSQMPNFGADQILTPEQITDVANFALSLSGGEGVDAAAAERGKTVFAENCAACHGDNGAGNHDFGAPNLTDKLWLYGNTLSDVMAQVTKPHMGVMPAWTGRLDEATLKEITVYVHSLGGGEQTAVTQ